MTVTSIDIDQDLLQRAQQPTATASNHDTADYASGVLVELLKRIRAITIRAAKAFDDGGRVSKGELMPELPDPDPGPALRR